jgi:hypothetical protein
MAFWNLDVFLFSVSLSVILIVLLLHVTCIHVLETVSPYSVKLRFVHISYFAQKKESVY